VRCLIRIPSQGNANVASFLGSTVALSPGPLMGKHIFLLHKVQEDLISSRLIHVEVEGLRHRFFAEGDAGDHHVSDLPPVGLHTMMGYA
jgi:hypothetical protein